MAKSEDLVSGDSLCIDGHRYSIPEGATLDGTTAQVVDVLKRENVSRELIEVLNIRFAGQSQRKAFIEAFNQLANSARVHHIAFESAGETILIAPEACGC